MTVRHVLIAAAVILSATTLDTRTPAQAQGRRVNGLIAHHAAGQPAIVHTDWAWMNMEDKWDPERLRKVLTDLKKDSSAPPIVPVLRVPSGGSEGPAKYIEFALGLGVPNIVIPKISGAAEVRRLVSLMRYPQKSGSKYPEPRGERREAPGQAPAYWGMSKADYMRKADLWPLNPEGELAAIVMIESKASVESIEEILRVPGLGGILIGPYDLGDSLGVGRPRGGKILEATEAAIQKVRAACQAYGKVICGLAGADISKKDRRLKEGWNMIQFLAPGVPASR
jgi:4-hydroxy-2-oxoheptanedioate aldolase